MRIGGLRGMMTIQHEVTTGYSEINEPIVEWQTFRKNVYVEVTALRGKEQFNAETGQRFSETVYKFRCRFAEVEGMSEKARIFFDGQTYDVRTLQPDRQKKSDCVIEATNQDGVV